MQNGDLLVERENSKKAMEDLKKKYDQESANRRIAVHEKMILFSNLDALKKELQEREKENQVLMATKCNLSLMLKEAQNAKKMLEKEHTDVLQAKESLNAELKACCSEKNMLLRDGLNLQEECQKLNEKIHTMQQSLVLEKEARTQDQESSLYESNKLHRRVALLEQEVEKLRACTQELQSENCTLIQDKTNSEQTVADIIKEKELLSAETARLAADIETLKSDFAALCESKLELQELHNYLTKMLDDLQLNHEVTLAEQAKALQDNRNLLAEKREMMLKRDELLKEKEKLAESYFFLQKEITQLAKINSHISANLLESQSENLTLRKDKNKLTLKIRELETLQSFTAAQTAEGAMQIVEQMTKEKTEPLASLEDPKQTNEKLQNELDTLKESNLKNVEELNKTKELLMVENQKIEEFMKEMETLKQAAAQKSQQLSALQEENVKLNEELGRNRDEVTSQQKLEEERPVLSNQLLEMKKSDDQEKQSKKKPRLFCDVCDCFDLHNTEDCPTQAQMSEDPPHSTHHGSRSEERPYCEICEMFGHWATDCNDDETF